MKQLFLLLHAVKFDSAPVRILFLNQYFPPDPAPTGVLFHEIAERLSAAGHAVDFVSSGQKYREGQAKGGRMRREAAALGHMLRKGVRSRRPDVVVSGTSPPCLLWVATLVAARHGARSIHWAMDVYPELALALGEIPAGFLSAAFSKVTGWCYRRTDRVIALDEDMTKLLARYGTAPVCLRPWVFESISHEVARLCASEMVNIDGGLPWTWIYSGNLGRAHEWETLLEAQAIIERRNPEIRLLFQGGGPAWQAAQRRAAELGLRNCEWRPYVEEAELPASLLKCHVAVVSQRPEAQGLLWPSKLGLLLSLPRPILWVGPTTGAIASMLDALPGSGVFPPGNPEGVAEWILSRRKGPSPLVQPAVDAGTHRRHSLDTWQQWIEELRRK